MAQRQFRSDDTAKWKYGFGNGADGAASINTSTDAPIDSACTGTIGATSLAATNASFAAGQLILIHQTRGTGAGQWELNKIASYTAGTITLAHPLIFGYATGAQVIVMAQNTTVVVNSAQTLTGKSWNGSVGGIVVKLAKESITVTGNIRINGAVGGSVAGGISTGGAAGGFRGGNGRSGANPNTSFTGEGTTGAQVQQSAANGNGGGGAITGASSASGGGGGNGAAGAAGTGGAGTQGAAGGAVGNADLTIINLGGGGGGGSRDDGARVSGAGGSGGGIVFLISKAVTVTGAITVNGAQGGLGNIGAAGGGGGAGGSVLIKGQVLVLGTTLVAAAAGAGGGEGGGAGAVGRIHADYKTSISGTTSPTIDSRQDNSLKPYLPSGGALLMQI